MSIIQTGRPGRWMAAGFTAAGLALLAACGSSADSTSAPGATTSTPDSSGTTATAGADADEYAGCMTENGVTLAQPSEAPPSDAPMAPPPSAAAGPPPAPQGVDDDTWTAALDACKAFMPSPPSGGAPPTTRN